METIGLVSHVVLWMLVLVLAFLLLGALRGFGILSWKLEELEATTPNRVGRGGLKAGKSAPDFTLTNVEGRDVSLRDFAGRPVLLVFVQVGCGPCHAIAPELNKLARKGGLQLLIVIHGEPEAAREWARDVKAEFPVLIQERWNVSKQYEAYATPFAFLIDAGGIVRSSGIAGSRQHLGYVISGAGKRAEPDHVEPQQSEAKKVDLDGPITAKEVSHV
jgi:methylamine dehydrogenase accessory protein MauD